MAVNTNCREEVTTLVKRELVHVPSTNLIIGSSKNPHGFPPVFAGRWRELNLYQDCTEPDW